MLLRRGGQSIQFGEFGNELSMELVFLHEVFPSGGLDLWQRSVDHKLLEITRRIDVVEEQNRFLKQLILKVTMSIDQKDALVSLINKDIKNMEEQNNWKCSSLNNEPSSVSVLSAFSEESLLNEMGSCLNLDTTPKKALSLEIVRHSDTNSSTCFFESKDLPLKDRSSYEPRKLLSVRSAERKVDRRAMLPQRIKERRLSVPARKETKHCMTKKLSIPLGSHAGDKEILQLDKDALRLPGIRAVGSFPVSSIGSEVKLAKERPYFELEESFGNGTKKSYAQVSFEDRERRSVLRQLLRSTLTLRPNEKESSEDFSKMSIPNAI